MTPERWQQLKNMLESGDIGDVEFTELALESGESIEHIEQALADARAEDGEIDF